MLRIDPEDWTFFHAWSADLPLLYGLVRAKEPQLSASFRPPGNQRTKRTPSSESCFGLRWQARDSGPARDTALDSRDPLESLFQNLFGPSEPKRRRRVGPPFHALPAHSKKGVNDVSKMSKLQGQCSALTAADVGPSAPPKAQVEFC